MSTRPRPCCEATARENRRLRQENRRLREETARLKDLLERARRAGKRQAAPFSKGAPNAQPRRPGRRPGADYGRAAHRVVPTQIDEVVAVPLPPRCPGSTAALELVARGAVKIADRIEEEVTALGRLMNRYAEVPMPLADACLVRMVEQHPAPSVLTLDRDFRVYRAQGRRVIPVVKPSDL